MARPELVPGMGAESRVWSMAVLMVCSRWKSCVEITLDRDSQQLDSCSEDCFVARGGRGRELTAKSGLLVIGCWLLVVCFPAGSGNTNHQPPPTENLALHPGARAALFSPSAALSAELRGPPSPLTCAFGRLHCMGCGGRG